MPRLHGERFTRKFYDAMFCMPFEQLSDLPSSFKLFGNANIGNPAFTSLHVPGTLYRTDAQGGNIDEDLEISRWYTRSTLQMAQHANGDHDLEEAARLFGIFADMTIAQLVIGERIVLTSPLSEIQRYEVVKAELPPRRNVSVHVNMFGPAKEALIAAARLSFRVDSARIPGWPALWIHLECAPKTELPSDR